MEAPRQKIARHDHSFAQISRRYTHCRGKHSSEEPGRRMAFGGVPLRLQPLARNPDNLRSQDRYWLVAAKNDRVSRLNVLWPMSLDHPQYLSAQENAAIGGN